MNEFLEMLRSISPQLLIVAGIALLVTPAFLRYIVGVGLILLGLNEMYPDLWTDLTQPQPQQP